MRGFNDAVQALRPGRHRPWPRFPEVARPGPPGKGLHAERVGLEAARFPVLPGPRPATGTAGSMPRSGEAPVMAEPPKASPGRSPASRTVRRGSSQRHDFAASAVMRLGRFAGAASIAVPWSGTRGGMEPQAFRVVAAPVAQCGGPAGAPCSGLPAAGSGRRCFRLSVLPARSSGPAGRGRVPRRDQGTAEGLDRAVQACRRRARG